MRNYSFLAMRPGGFMNWPGGEVTATRSRIRCETCVIVFRRWFGRAPTFSWGKDGVIAEAWDERGNRMQLEQFNHGDPALREDDTQMGWAARKHVGKLKPIRFDGAAPKTTSRQVRRAEAFASALAEMPRF